MRYFRKAVGAAGLMLGTLAAATVSPASAQSDDVTFYVVAKTVNYEQDPDGELQRLKYHYFAEIFLTADGTVEKAWLRRAGSEYGPVAFEDRGDVLYIEGGFFKREEALDAAYPNGTYIFNIETPSGDIRDQALRLAGPGGDNAFPGFIRIVLIQNGAAVAPDAVDPSQAMTVRWTPFANGGPDPTGVLDDLIFLVIGDCEGGKVVHSGRPFGGGDYLTYEDTEYTVPAGTFAPGEPYSMYVEHADLLETTSVGGVAGLSTYANSTYLGFRTAGAANDRKCPRTAPKVDWPEDLPEP